MCLKGRAQILVPCHWAGGEGFGHMQGIKSISLLPPWAEHLNIWLHLTNIHGPIVGSFTLFDG